MKGNIEADLLLLLFHFTSNFQKMENSSNFSQKVGILSEKSISNSLLIIHFFLFTYLQIGRLEIFVWTFGGILFTPRDMLCRINSRLIFRKNFSKKKWNELLRQLLNLHLKILHIKRGMESCPRDSFHFFGKILPKY